uniref:DUF7049 domain-containing protein n=1 Tax=Aegilops tauschii TaxID=37682 RepID=M8BV51_AEGTA
MAADIAGLHSALADPFWPADLDLMVSTHEVEGIADMDASGFFVGGGDDRFMLPSSTTSSLSSKRSLSLDSGGSSGSGSFSLDLADASRDRSTLFAEIFKEDLLRKKDKTTVLTKAAWYLKTLEAQVSELEEKNNKLEKHIPTYDREEDVPHQQRRQRAKVQITKAASDEVVNLTVMVMVECDVVELVLRILECLRWMEQVSVMSVDADTYSPQVLLKAIASIKLRIVDHDWNEALFHEAMAKAVNDATVFRPPLVLTA